MKVNILGDAIDTSFIIMIEKITEKEEAGKFKFFFTIYFNYYYKYIVEFTVNKFEGNIAISKDIIQDNIREKKLRINNLRSRLIRVWTDEQMDIKKL